MGTNFVPLIEIVDREVVDYKAFVDILVQVEFVHEQVEDDLLLLVVFKGLEVVLCPFLVEYKDLPEPFGVIEDSVI